jgi:hypothetical protein
LKTSGVLEKRKKKENQKKESKKYIRKFRVFVREIKEDKN